MNKGYIWRDIEELAKPRNGFVEVFVDYWWVVNSLNQICLYGGKTPQCNRDRRIGEGVLALHWKGQDVHLELLPVIFLPHRCEDYVYNDR